MLFLQLSAKPTTTSPPADLKPTVEFVPTSPEKSAPGVLAGQTDANGDDIVAIDDGADPGALVERSNEQMESSERSDKQAESVERVDAQPASVEPTDPLMEHVDDNMEPVDQSTKQNEPLPAVTSALDTPAQADPLTEFYAEIAPDLEHVESGEQHS